MSLQVIGAGLGRTGTFSLKLALEILGYGKCYHMYDLLENRSDIEHWENIYNRNTVDYESLFCGYGSSVDYPTCCYIDDLIKVYPDAKVILTVRDFDSWYASAIQTILIINPSIIQKLSIIIQQPFSKNAKYLARIGTYMSKIINNKMLDINEARTIYNEHNKYIRALNLSDNLLVYNVISGWRPLCDFLKKEVPDIDFPHANKRKDFNKKIKPLLW